MTDLRERVYHEVQLAVDFASDASLEENEHEGNERTDAVLAVVAAWLREVSLAGRDINTPDAVALRLLADQIDPRETP